ncbi:MAG TPA: hypothetical protein VF190_04225 [Rhodothermales bacterium]
MTPDSRRLLLATHIIVSVGWIGAILAYLALVVNAMVVDSEQLLRASWFALELIGWYVIVPLALAALITGIAIAFGTRWGLIRHYWVAASLVLTAISTAVLLKHMGTVTYYAGIAATGSARIDDVLRSALRGELLHAGIGCVILLGIATLNVYKPRGLTAYGRSRAAVTGVTPARSGSIELSPSVPATSPRWMRVVGYHAAALLILLAILHAFGGMRLHG